MLALWSAGTASAAPPVTNTNDSGFGSLRAAIAIAAPGDTITVPPGTITLTSGPLTVGQTLTIVGSGEGQTTISGNGQTQQIFSITGTPVTLQALTLTGGGNAVFGGAIRTTGDLTLDHVAVTNSTSGTFGGGVFAGGHSLSVTDSTFSGDTTGTSGGAIEFGNTTSVSGDTFSVHIAGSTFTNNSAGGGGSSGHGGAVGFIPNAGGSATNVVQSLEVDNSLFSANTAGGGGGSGAGAAIDYGGSDGSSNAHDVFKLTLAGDEFSQNSAAGSGGGTGHGGAVEFLPGVGVTNDVSMVSVTGSQFTNNTAGSAASGTGGGIDVAIPIAPLNMAISGSTFAGNTAGSGGPGSGGGLSLQALDASTAGSATLTNDTFTANQVAPSAAATDNGTGGGLVLNDGAGFVSLLVNDTIAGNVAFGLGHGGGVMTGGPVHIVNSIVAGNVGGAQSDCYFPGSPPISDGGNLEDGTTCGFTSARDHQNTPPTLSPLADTGGPALPDGSHLLTISPHRGSLAIGGAVTAQCPATDERGIARPQGNGCDIGAVEDRPGSATTGAASNISTNSAVVTGTVVPGDAGSGVTIQWGPTPAYGEDLHPLELDPGTTPQAIAVTIGPLLRQTTYHYRIIADDGGEQVAGADRTFTTGPPPPGSIALLTRLATVRRGRIALRLSCTGASSGCRGTAAVTIRAKRTLRRHHHTHTVVVTLTLGKTPFVLASGAAATVSVHVGSLKQSTRAHAQIRRTDGGLGANPAITLVVPKPKPKHRRHR